MSAYIALACVCFFWGTTYLGIRISLESFSPSLLMCVRYTFSGAALLTGAFIRRAQFPAFSEAWRTALYGVVTIGLGTGSLAFAEQWIPSGLAALIVSTQPFWMIGMEAFVSGGEKLHAPALRGMLVGLLGVILLIAPTAITGQGMGGISSRDLLRGFLLLQFGAAMWSAGSIAQRRIATQVHPFVSGGVEQLATGLAFAFPALLWQRHAAWAPKGIAAITYLAIFGGIVGYSSYIYSMARLPVALVSIYTYINPLVAVLLGYLFYREPFGWRETGSMLVIFLGVAMVKAAARRKESSFEKEESIAAE